MLTAHRAGTAPSQPSWHWSPPTQRPPRSNSRRHVSALAHIAAHALAFGFEPESSLSLQSRPLARPWLRVPRIAHAVRDEGFHNVLPATLREFGGPASSGRAPCAPREGVKCSDARNSREQGNAASGHQEGHAAVPHAPVSETLEARQRAIDGTP